MSLNGNQSSASASEVWRIVHMSIGSNMVCFAGQRYISLKGNTSSASASEGGRIRTLTHVLRESLKIIE
jgi:hypothetical protein